MDIIPIESLFDDKHTARLTAESRAALADADVIIGVDARDHREFTVFGTPSLEESTTFKTPVAMRTVRVSLDYKTGELDELLSLVQSVKGLRVFRPEQ